MTESENLNIGDLVRLKPISDKVKNSLAKRLPYMTTESEINNDIGVVFEVIPGTDKTKGYVNVRWQKLEKECSHFPITLNKICSAT
jgi:hypothetical protein